MPIDIPSKPAAIHLTNSPEHGFRKLWHSPVQGFWPHPFRIYFGLIVVEVLLLVFLMEANAVASQNDMAWTWAMAGLCGLMCLGCARAYHLAFALHQQHLADRQLVQKLGFAPHLGCKSSPTQQLYQHYTEQLEFGMLASFMLLQDTRNAQQALHTHNKQHQALHEDCLKQQHTIEGLVKHCAQQQQNTKNNLESCTKVLHDHSDIQSHLQACKHELGEFNQFAFECKQTIAVLHRHRHSQLGQTSPAVQQQQQQLLGQLEQMQGHSQDMLQHMHQAQVGLNAMEQQYTALHMALQQHQEQELRAEKACLQLHATHNGWQQHVQQAEEHLQQTLLRLHHTEELAMSLDRRLKG